MGETRTWTERRHWPVACWRFGLAAPALGFAASDENIIEQIIVTAQKRASALQDVPFSVAAASEEQIRDSGSTNIVGPGAQLRRPHHHRPRPRAEPGRDPRHQRRPGRARPSRRREGIRRRVPRRVGDLAWRCSRRTSICSTSSASKCCAARRARCSAPARRRARCATSRASRSSANSKAPPKRRATPAPIPTSAGNLQRRRQRAAGGHGGAARGRLLQRARRLHRLGVSGPRQARGRQQRREDAARASRCCSSRTRTSRSRRASSIRSWRPTAIRASIVYNILGNPFTTTQPPVNPGERGQVTQIREGIDDEFTLADLDGQLGPRRRDADVRHLVHGSRRGGGARRIAAHRQRSSRSAASSAHWPDPRDFGGSAPELAAVRYHERSRPSARKCASPPTAAMRSSGWSARSTRTSIASTARICRRRATTLFLTRRGLPPSSGFNAPPNTPYFSQVPFTLQAVRAVRRRHLSLHRPVERDRRPAVLRLRRRPLPHVRRRVRRLRLHLRQPGSTSSDGFSPRAILAYEPNDDVLLTAQVARGFRLGGINDPLNVALCTPPDLRHVQRQSGLQGREGDELRARREDAAGRRPRHAQRRGVLLGHRRPAGDRGRRLVLLAHRAQRAGRVDRRGSRAVRAPERRTGTWACPPRGCRPRSPRRRRTPRARRSRASATATACRLRRSSRPRRARRTAGRSRRRWKRSRTSRSSTWARRSRSSPTRSRASASWAAGPAFFPFGNPTITGFTFDPELPSYEIGNLRFGVKNDAWEAAVYVNNVWDERAFLSLDRERGFRARVSAT